ncbi:hypothetical protein FWK35_00006539 [Aphis craccivora]|uniref:Uncharacterized protein n=1 Tax=Aphis craccivora TaxID=307492 RepID=A0A6G0ZN84_APHCR|nr:hypothetical protein FWK35_00006539 [Aphis craccivora]
MSSIIAEFKGNFTLRVPFDDLLLEIRFKKI